MTGSPRVSSRQRRILTDAAVLLVLAALVLTPGRTVLYSADQHNPKAAFVATAAHRDAVWALLVAAGQLVALPFARRWPLLAFLACGAGLVAHLELLAAVQQLAPDPFLGPPLLASDLSVALALYAFTSKHGLLRASPLVVAAVALAGLAVARAVQPWSWTTFALLCLLAVLSGIAGETSRARRDYVLAIESRAAEQRHQHAQQLELAAATERARVAADIHDSVAHGLSIIVVQAQAADAALASDPASARESLEAVIATGRQALTEIRRSLAAIIEPAQQLLANRLAELVAQAQAAGMPVRLDICGDVDGLRPEIDAAVYRVAQEGLTNARKHAGPSVAAEVAVRRIEDTITIEVTNAPGAAAANPGEGLGIEGMHRRVGALGGRFHAGPVPTGGYAVTAALPVAPR
jgi:signal transduction histidine kinase